MHAGEKLIDHLKKWLEPDKLAGGGHAWASGQEVQVAAATLHLFHLLPPQAAKFLESGVRSCAPAHLQPHLLLGLASFFAGATLHLPPQAAKYLETRVSFTAHLLCFYYAWSMRASGLEVQVAAATLHLLHILPPQAAKFPESGLSCAAERVSWT